MAEIRLGTIYATQDTNAIAKRYRELRGVPEDPSNIRSYDTMVGGYIQGNPDYQYAGDNPLLQQAISEFKTGTIQAKPLTSAEQQGLVTAGATPEQIKTGIMPTIPTAPTGTNTGGTTGTTTGTIKEGQNLSTIVQSLGITPQEFLKLNPQYAAKGNKGDYQGLTGLIQPNQTYVIPGLPKAQAPTIAGNIKTTGGLQMPTISPTGGEVSGATAATTGLNSYYDLLIKQQQDYQTRLTAAQTEQEKTRKSIFDFLGTTKSSSQLRAEEYAKIGVSPTEYFADQKAKIAEIGSLTQEYNSVKAAKDQAIAGSYDKLATNSFINNQIAQIERNAAPRLNELSANINSKASVLQALQGNFAEAQRFVNQAVNDTTADYKFKMDTLSTFYELNKDVIDDLDKRYQTAFNNAFALAKETYDNQVTDRKEVGGLMINNPQAGILITDSVETAYQKAGATPKAVKPEIFGSAEAGYYQQVYDSKTNTYKNVPVAGGTGGETTETDIQTYATAYLNNEIEVTNIPEKYRAKVIALATQMATNALKEPPVSETTLTETTPRTPFFRPRTPTAPTGGLRKTYEAPNITPETLNSFFNNLFGS